MPITVEELKNIITGDDSQFQTVAKRTEATMASLEAQAKQATAVISSTFSGIAAPLNGLTQSFQTVGAAANSSFNQVVQSGAAVNPVLNSISGNAATVGNAVAAAGVAAGNGLGQIASAAEIAGESVARNGNGASAGLNTVAASSNGAGQAAARMGSEVAAAASGIGVMAQSALTASGSVSELLLRKAELAGQLAIVSKELRSETSVMLGAQEAAKLAGASSTQLNQIYGESQAKVAELAVKQQLLKTELGNVSGALKSATTAQTATNVAQGAAAVATEEMGKKTGILSALMNTHTSQISSQGTAWKGYDNVVQAVIRSMGGIPVVWALAITVGGVLLEKLLSMGKAKKDLATISEELIQQDVGLAQTFGTLAERASGTNDVLNQQAQLYERLVEGDIKGVIGGFATAYEDYAEKAKAATAAQVKYDEAVAQATAVARDFGGSLEEAGKVGLATYERNLRSAGDALNTANQEQEKALKVLGPYIQSVNAYSQATGESTEAILRNSDAALLGAQAHAGLEAMLLRATSAQEQLNAAAANYRPPKLDATLQTYDQLRSAINANAADLEKAGKTQGEILIALKPQLEALKKATIAKAAADLTSAGASLKNSAAQKMLGDELKKGGDKAAEYAGKLPALDRNIRALSSTTQAHASAARAARPALDEYKAGVEGAQLAIEKILGAAPNLISKLFEPTAKGARQMSADWSAAFKSAADAVNSFLQSQGIAAKTSSAEVAKMVAEGKTSLLSYTDAWLKQEEVVRRAGIEMAQSLNAPLKDVNAALKAAGFELQISAKLWSQLTDEQKRNVVQISDAVRVNLEMGRAADAESQAIKGATEQITLHNARIKDAFDAYQFRMIPASQLLAVITGKTADSFEKLSTEAVTNKRALDRLNSRFRSFAETMRDTMKMVDDALESTFDVNFANVSLKANQQIDSLINTFARFGTEVLGKTGDSLRQFVQEKVGGSIDDAIKILQAKLPWLSGIAKQQLEALINELSIAGPRMIAVWNDALRGLPEPLTRALNKMLDALGVFATKSREKVKDSVAGIIQVLDAIPGKLHNIAQSFLDWVNRIDQILQGLHKVFKKIPDGLGGVLESVVGIFKKTQVTVGGVASEAQKAGTAVSDAMKAGASATAQSATRIIGSLGSIAGAFMAFAGARNQGPLGGAISGALGGLAALGGIAGLMHSAFAPLLLSPWGALAVGGGALLGGLIGLFHKKSPLEKAQEAAQLQQAKDAVKLSQQQVLQAVEQTKQSTIETLNQARELLESIQFYTKVPKLSFDAFFKDVRKLFDRMIGLAKDFASAATADVKQAAENMKPVVELVAMLPAALDGINAHLKVPDIQFDSFFADTTALIEKLATAMEEIPRKVKRHARQFGDAIGDAFKIVPDTVTALANLFDIKDVPEEKLNIFESVLRKLTDRIAVIADNTDKYLLKAVAFFAEKMGGAVSLMKDGVDLIKAMVDLPVPTEEQFNNLFQGLETGLNKAIETALRVTSESLPLATAIWEKAKSIFEAVKSGVDTVKAVAEAKWPEQAAWDAFVAAVSQMLTALTATLDKMLEGESISDRIRSASSNIADNLAASAANITAAAQSLASLSFGGTPAAAAAGVSAASLAPSSLAYAPSLPAGPVISPSGPISSTTTTTRSSTVQIGTVVFPPPATGDLATYERFRQYAQRWIDELRGSMRAEGLVES